MNDEVETFINEMLPNELEIVKSLIDSLIDSKSKTRETNLNYLNREKNNIKCPINEEHKIKKNGHKSGTQRYYCKDCNKSFSITNGTIIKYSNLNYNQFKTFLKCMYDYKPLNETALEVGISKTATFELQIRIFAALDQIYSRILLKGEIQVDEKYVRTSFKGFRPEQMPRPSRHNGNSDLTSGISEDQVCIVAAIDSYDNLVIKVVGNSSASKEMIALALNDKIEKDSTLITDSKNSYVKFSEENKLKLIQIPSGHHQFNGYSINDINEIMTEISLYLYKKRGVSSRHLQHHLNFIRYRKIIKYTIEYLNINEEMFVNTLNLNIFLNCNDVYSTELPFDIEEYETWYLQHH